MSHNIYAYAALISNISERDRAKYVEQFDDILTKFINHFYRKDSARSEMRKRCS